MSNTVRVLFAITLLCLVTGELGAQQRSRRHGQQPATTGGAQPSGEAAAATAEALRDRAPQPSEQQQANIDRLVADLNTLGEGGRAAQAEITKLVADLQGMALQPPDTELLQQLAVDLQAALADSTLQPMEMARLTQDLYAVLNSAGLSSAEIEVLKQDVTDVLTASGVGQAEIQAICADLEAIWAEAQNNAGAGAVSQQGSASGQDAAARSSGSGRGRRGRR